MEICKPVGVVKAVDNVGETDGVTVLVIAGVEDECIKSSTDVHLHTKLQRK